MAGAEEFFEQARDAARDMERIKSIIAEMHSREDIGGAPFDTIPTHGASGGPMSKVDARLDFEQLSAARLEEAERTIDDAVNLLYGKDGRGGLARALGSKYADLLWLRYLDSRTIDGLAIINNCARGTVYNQIRTALDFIDSNGFTATIQGRNIIS